MFFFLNFFSRMYLFFPGIGNVKTNVGWIPTWWMTEYRYYPACSHFLHMVFLFFKEKSKGPYALSVLSGKCESDWHLLPNLASESQLELASMLLKSMKIRIGFQQNIFNLLKLLKQLQCWPHFWLPSWWIPIFHLIGSFQAKRPLPATNGAGGVHGNEEGHRECGQ